MKKEKSKLEELIIDKEPESFQKALDEIAKIVDELESTQNDLERSVKLFKRGSFLNKWAEAYLNEMEEEIKKITDSEV
ncbi:MAG: exodeoxyribonuclease VII small subunit [Clostridiaceae bacterium]|nr:exodeoxyribonuclease VII small subunit [Clostridiaceae bacterium]